MKSLSKIVKALRMRLAGHLLRQTEDRSASVAINWIPEDGKRPKWRPQKNLVYSVHRRSARFWNNTERCKEDCQWLPEMEEPCCPMFQWELEELSVS